ncbi:MAG: hypothetical protein NC898_00625 [Candidatus Omnitrophica bacterium]|nr:hypothetical protein [Candidatus Omnitrophota bacterium]MCM8792961.1 hypothetical protein [Candidatus Omnitrophota bacterium]
MHERVLAVFFIFCTLSTLLLAEEPKFTEGMNQFDFAKLLVKEANLETHLSPTPNDEDYFKVLIDLEIEPIRGWSREGIITREDLLYILGYSGEEAKDMSFAELCQQVISLLKEISSEEQFHLFEQ